ncbi:MAG: type III pantothenate kinase [Polyangiaceae bacterium]
MLLAIDIGNSGIAFGLFDGSKLVHQFHTESARNRTADEYAVVLSEMTHLGGFGGRDVSAAIIASVVPSVTDAVLRAVEQCFSLQPHVVSPASPIGLVNLYQPPGEVGADRLVNAVAAFERVHGAAVVVDFSTATIFDCISAQGEYLGGCIAPGVQVSADALVSKASKLHRVDLSAPPRVVGKNSAHAMQSGLLYGHAGLVDGLLKRIKGEIGSVARVIATGPLVRVMAPFVSQIDEIDETLTLTGLRIVHERLPH